MKLYTDELKNAPLTAGETLLLSGVLYTGRDQAHKRFMELLDAGHPLPFPASGAALYYAGPTAAPPGHAIGSCGPTTSGRMDAFAPRLYDLGLAATIGKGQRNREVCDAILRNHALYLCAVGGAGALIASCVTDCTVVAFPELGCEAVHRLTVKHLPLITAIDGLGGNLFERNDPADRREPYSPFGRVF